LPNLCKPAKPVIITSSFANQPSQSSQDLCKTATHQHQKVILRLICMELPTSKNTNAHMTTSKAWSDTSALFMSKNQSTTNVSNIAEENRQQVEQIPLWWPAKQKTTKTPLWWPLN
jgi:GTPase Era involved in 16S rRNA processing